jgi:hypothetical protein
LVDEYHWKIAHTHPPWLARVFVLARAAESLRRGSSKNLLKVHGDLSEVDVKIRQTADAQRAETVAAVRALIKEATRFADDRPRSFRTFSSCASWPFLALPAADDGP